MHEVLLQLDDEAYSLAERAASAAGSPDVKTYITELVMAYAPDELRDCGPIRLTNEEFDSFLHNCENPPKLSPSNKLIEAARRLDEEGYSLLADR